MKINRAARRLVRARFSTLCVLVACLGFLEVGLGASVAGHLGRVNAPRRPVTQAPSVNLGDLFAAGR